MTNERRLLRSRYSTVTQDSPKRCKGCAKLWVNPGDGADMPLVRAHVSSGGDLVERGLEARLRRAVADLPEDAPVIVMIHGYKFSPRSRATTPHNHIL